MVTHSSLTGSDLHESKGVAAASANTVFVVDGVGSGSWSKLTQNSVSANGIGYATGAGGTVTQTTSKSTGATLNKICGRITMDGASLAAATIVTFVLTNSTIADGDVIIINHYSTGTIGAYTVNGACQAGSASVSLRNNTAGALAEAIVLQFAVIKAVTT